MEISHILRASQPHMASGSQMGQYRAREDKFSRKVCAKKLSLYTLRGVDYSAQSFQSQGENSTIITKYLNFTKPFSSHEEPILYLRHFKVLSISTLI